VYESRVDRFSTVMPGRKNRQVVVLDDKTIYQLRKRGAMFFGRL